jgi:23S rRNA (adenine2503-C2)-methyltransferase
MIPQSDVLAGGGILDLTLVQLKDFLKSLGEPAVRAGEIWHCLYRDYTAGFDHMASLTSGLRQKLAQNAGFGTLELMQDSVSSDAQTRKGLFRLWDAVTVESALMISANAATGRERRTVCVSSQVGCSVGCRFCSTGRQGFERNLGPGEIVHQVLHFARLFGVGAAKNAPGPITNVVFMGMGEPLANYDNVIQAVRILNDQRGLGLGAHQVTISTAGLVPQILRLSYEKVQFQLAVSLHAANDKLRDTLVPVNKKFPLDRLMSAVKDFSEKKRRNIFIEYALFNGINDSPENAEDLTRLLQGLKCSINLIVGNDAGTDEFRPSSGEAAVAFQQLLMSRGYRTMLRFSRGADIDAGCGQLRSRTTLNS